MLTITALYEVDEETVLTALARFLDKPSVSVTDTVSVTTMTTSVSTYRESFTRVTIETIDETERARAQRICQANGVDDPLALANCLLDVVATQDETYVESAVSFEQTIADIPREQRVGATSFARVLDPTVILPPARVIEIVGPPEVVPEITAVVMETRKEDMVVTTVTSITSTVNQSACTEVEGLRTPAELLGDAPQAGGVAIFCATHARDQTVTVQLGRKLDDALGRAQASCPQEAQSRVADYGEIVIPCREIGRGERAFDFGGGVLSIGRDVRMTLTSRIVEKPEVPDGLSLVLEPATAITAACMQGETVPIEGLSVIDGLLDYDAARESDFQNLCSQIEMLETDDDYVLQATCFTADASDVRTSAVTLLGLQAIRTLIEDPKCAPEPEPVPVAEGPQPEITGDFVPFAEDGLQVDFPGRGDFVLIRGLEAGIAVHARRDLWVSSDRSKVVFSALRMKVGADSVEVYAAPTEKLLVNGLPMEDAGLSAEGNVLTLPGGGRITIDQAAGTIVVNWPESSFAMRLAINPRSHIVPAVQIDAALSYEGLARFTVQWLIEAGSAGFTDPLGSDPTCDCAQ